MPLFRGGTVANLQLRFAGTDLAPASARGRTLSLILWAVTIGGVIGPNLAGPTTGLAEALGLPPAAGPVAIAVPLLILGALICAVLLRPDPLRLAREIAHRDRGVVVARTSIASGLRLAWSHRDGRLGLVTVVTGHATMVAVMVMTPVHIGHIGGSLTVVGIVISAHIVGMYAFSPVVGWLTDRYGARVMVRVAAAVLLLACGTAATAGEHGSTQLAIGLFLLGVGWSASIVPGSVLVAGSAGPDQRPAVQGASDLVMGVVAALVAVGSGPVVDGLGFPVLALMAAVVALPALLLSLTPSQRSDRPQRQPAALGADL